MSEKNILVIDDETEIVKFIEKVLNKNGYQVDSTSDPQDALRKVSENSYDVLITDIKMPGMSGLDIIRKIGEMKLARPPEIIIITAHATVDTAIECMRAGAMDYLIKPFEMKEILATVEKAMEVSKIKSRLVSMEEMDRLKDDFIATVTHELKTPLMAISGAAELLETIEDSDDKLHKGEGPEVAKDGSAAMKPDDTKREVRKFANIVLRQTNKMKHLVDDLLDSARMSANRLTITKAPVNIGKLIKEAIADIQPLAAAKNISVSYHNNNDKDIIVKCDYNQIKRVLNNLIVNSIKYTHENGKVEIRATCNEASGTVEFSVTDNGKGLKKDDLEKIFEKFYRVDQSLSREEGGFGLGLSIAKKIIELHGGTIRAESPGLGKGTTVTFTLPVRG